MKEKNDDEDDSKISIEIRKGRNPGNLSNKNKWIECY